MKAAEAEAGGESGVIERAICNDDIRSLQLPNAPVTVSTEATLQEVVEILQDQHIGCVLVVDPAGKLAGIFTERDLLNRVAGKRLDWSQERVAPYMTADPETLRLDDRIAWALNFMHLGGYRHVPLTDDEHRPVGVVSVKDIVSFLVELFPAPVLNLPPDPHRKPADQAASGEG